MDERDMDKKGADNRDIDNRDIDNRGSARVWRRIHVARFCMLLLAAGIA